MEEEEMKRKQPTRWERIFRATAYACVGLTGVAVIVFYNSMGWTVIAWAVLLIAGLPASYQSAKGHYRAEYGFLPVMVGGLLIYALYEWYDTLTYLPSVASALLATSIVAKFLSRFAHLHALVKLIKEEL
jgi:hypothetical protein